MKPTFRRAYRKLEKWFSAHSRVLPWRSRSTVYRVWISEIMLQQTTVAAVIPYYQRFLKRFPDVRRLAAAKLADVLRYWAGLGYYARARNLHKAARIIAQDGYPINREEWLHIPGVGEYTAGAILSIAKDRPEPILDANVKRVLSRVVRLPPIQSARDKNRYWKIAREWVTAANQIKIRPSRFNQALMEIGALVCHATNPLCGECPLSAVCRSQLLGDPDYRPGIKKRKTVMIRETVHAVLSDGKILLINRPGRWRQGLWDLPDRLPDTVIKAGILPEGRLRDQYQVTHHVVDRTIRLWRLDTKDLPVSGPFRWYRLKQAVGHRLALGAPAVRAIRMISER